MNVNSILDVNFVVDAEKLWIKRLEERQRTWRVKPHWPDIRLGSVHADGLSWWTRSSRFCVFDDYVREGARNTKTMMKRMTRPRSCWTMRLLCFAYSRTSAARSTRHAHHSSSQLSDACFAWIILSGYESEQLQTCEGHDWDMYASQARLSRRVTADGYFLTSKEKTQRIRAERPISKICIADDLPWYETPCVLYFQECRGKL